VVSTISAPIVVLPPTNLSAKDGSSNLVNLTWTASTSSNIAHYYVVRSSSNSPAATIATLSNTTSFADSTVSPSTAYTYYLIASDSSGNISTTSNTATVTTPSLPVQTAPTTPTGLLATPVNAYQVNLTWNPSTDISGSVAGYYIYRSDKGTTPYAKVSAGTTWGESGLIPGKVYTYSVAAFNSSAQTSSQTKSVSVTMPSASGKVLLGSTKILSKLDTSNNGQAEAFTLKATSSGNISSLSFYLDKSTTASSIVIGIYTNHRGAPGALLAQSEINNPRPGAWNNASIANTNIKAQTRYWLAILGIGSGKVVFRDSANGRDDYSSKSTNLSNLPSNWVIGNKYNNSPIAAYGSD
jgi:hypothetical protein